MIYGFNASELFQVAIDIEENGRRFYEKAKDLIKSPEVKSLFAMLAKEEVAHKALFASLKAQLPESASEPTVWDPDNESEQYLKMMADMHVFRADMNLDQLLEEVQSAEDALSLAIRFEKDSVTFYLAMKDETESEKGREQIDQLVEEEKRHLRTLSMALRKHLASGDVA
jgi:rubrerythrin